MGHSSWAYNPLLVRGNLYKLSQGIVSLILSRVILLLNPKNLSPLSLSPLSIHGSA